MSKIVEIFGLKTTHEKSELIQAITDQNCPYSKKKCYKTRKSDSSIAIGTCTLKYSSPIDKKAEKVSTIICPNRLLERKQIFIDCLHLLTGHTPGNELHLVPEVKIPGGNVDFFLISAKDGKVKDFLGIELQTLDTTGTIWPERQNLLKELHILDENIDVEKKSFGMNWKMTAKTILVQMHHKVETFEHINKKMVLVIQDVLLDYMKKEFSFDHLKQNVDIADSFHLHAYQLKNDNSKQDFMISLVKRLSTDADGIGTCLGLKSEAKVELEALIAMLQSKISEKTSLILEL